MDLAPKQDSALVAELVKASRAPATLRAYRSDLKAWIEWSGGNDLPIETERLLEWLVAEVEAGRSVATLERRVAAVRAVHRAAGLACPTESEIFRLGFQGLRRRVACASSRTRPLWTSDLHAMLGRLEPETDLHDCRDAALLLLGWAAALRRSELVALDVSDLDFVEHGVDVHVRRSKADQEGKGDTVAVWHGQSINACPVASLRRWLDAAAIEEGAVFRSVSRTCVVGARMSSRSVDRIVKRVASRAGLEGLSAHSLRSGFASSAAAGGASVVEIQRVTRHASVTGLRPYLRRGQKRLTNTQAKAGL